jgi:Kef-type K+ transport system membrane component KefB
VNLPLLLLQVVVILGASRLIGWVFQRMHQPQVVGEMFAGILLGPSLLGAALPTLSAALFPPQTLGALNALSQLGLLLFMFLVGLELDTGLLRKRVHVAVVTSHASIIAPFLLGLALAVHLYPTLAPANVPFLHFALFAGTAMSITAFPVLARILTERHLLNTPIGNIAIACAAVDDITAWCVLAGVVLLVRSSAATMPFGVTIGGSLAYLGVMVFGVRRVARRFAAAYRPDGEVSQGLLALILLLVLLSALCTEWLGVHALFGAFLAGAVLPREHQFVEALTARLRDVTVVLLLPLFFAFTGLRTSIGLLNDPALWLDCALIILVAIAGKFGGSALVAHWSGMTWREASAIGILMNTRGLVELVALNVGLDIGVISPTLFTMMVFMALVTTFMTTPLLQRIYPPRFHERVNIGSLNRIGEEPGS